MPIISGVLKDGAGQPVAGCTIQLKAVNTTSAVIVTTTADVGTNAGEYRIEALPARYEVTLVTEGFRSQKVGIIDVYADSPDGSLNDFLTATKVEYLTPDVMNQFNLLAQQSREAADQANSASQGVSAIKDAAEKAASDALLSEQASKGAALAAKGSETSSADSAAGAKTSAAGAATSADSAKRDAASAATSKQDAATSATTAGTSATTAQTAATAAKASEDRAVLAETRAGTSAGSASTSASQAVASAAAALASQNAAKLSETNAGASADLAQAALRAAELIAKTPGPADAQGDPGSVTVTPAKFYRPAGDVSHWIAGTDSAEGNQDWKITQGTPVIPGYYMTPTNSGGQWEIQHPMSGPEDFFKYGLRSRFSCYFDDVDVATMEGKDLLEVRLVIPDAALPRWGNIPPATPDKPYLALGFIVRCVDGKYKIYDLDTDVTSANATTTTGTVYKRSTMEFSLALYSYGFYGAISGYTRYPKPIRTGVNTPANTLCIRSGANPVKETSFNYLGSVIPRETISHTLTPEDNNATFYCPWGYRSNLEVILPDTPLPEGFRVSLLSENESSITTRIENRNVTWNQSDGKPSSNIISGGGNRTLIQTGKNGKTWLFI